MDKNTVKHFLRQGIERDLGLPADDPLRRVKWQERQGFAPEQLTARYIICNAQITGDNRSQKEYFKRKVQDGD